MRGQTFNLRELLHSYATRKVRRKMPTSAPCSDVTWIRRNVFKQTRTALCSGRCSPHFACTEAAAVATPHRFTEEETEAWTGGQAARRWKAAELGFNPGIWLQGLVHKHCSACRVPRTTHTLG